MGHSLSGCLCVAEAARAQQDARASQPMADNYALAADRRTNEQTDKQMDSIIA